MFGLPFCLIFIFSHLSGVFSAEESAFRVPLYHRIFNPTSDPERFTERGILHYNGTALWIDTSPHFKEEMQGLTERSNKGGQEMLYQLALDNRPDSAISSVRAVCTHNLLSLNLINFVIQCHLHTAESDYLTVHVNSESVPFALDYFLSSVPQDGQCKKGRKIKPGAPLTKDTSIFIRKPTFVKE